MPTDDAHAEWFATLSGEELAEQPISLLTKRAWVAATRAVNEAIAEQLALAGVEQETKP